MSKRRKKTTREASREAEKKANLRKYKSWREVISERVPSGKPPSKRSDWIIKRNHIVCELIDKNPSMDRKKALKIANQRMRQKTKIEHLKKSRRGT